MIARREKATANESKGAQSERKTNGMKERINVCVMCTDSVNRQIDYVLSTDLNNMIATSLFKMSQSTMSFVLFECSSSIDRRD